ncbi:MAG TPA: histidine phosphatase family protein [Anaerolineae bacterium]|nr:histidine phosphatase family protein [Anaerolineae bacterium]HQH36972.1 histidine phosphatase family protein [Anaerolineae bacterium]
MRTTLVLVRHGQTAWNLEDRFRGRANIALDATGLAQAEATARYIATHWTPDAVYCSPLMRARQTAEKIAQPFRLHERVHPGLLDIDYGAWEGYTPEELRAQHWTEALELWYAHPQDAPIPGGETVPAVQLRALGALKEIMERHANGTVVIVAHTVVNRLLLLGILGLGNERFWHLGQDTGAINLIEFDGQDYTLLKLNDTCHLSGMGEQLDE